MVSGMAAFATGILAAHRLGINLVFEVLCSAMLLVVGLRLRRNGRWQSGLLLLLWFAAGVLRLDCAEQADRGSVVELAGQVVTIQGKINGAVTIAAGTDGTWRSRYQVELNQIIVPERNRNPIPARGGILLSVKQGSSLTRGVTGDEITATGKIKRIHTYHNPGQQDWEEALAARGIVARMTAAEKNLRVQEQDGLYQRLARWRAKVREELLQAMPPGDAALIVGMLFGGYDGIDRQNIRDFAQTGIVHILSVSGAHIALVAAAVFWLTRRLSAGSAWSAGVASAAMLVYGFVSGFSSPVVRSVVMGILAMAAIGAGRISYATHTLTLAVLGMLIWEPRSLFDISFQLSVGCTAGLLYLGVPLHDALGKYKAGSLAEFGATATAATLSAQLAVLPFLSWYFGFVPVISLLANLIVVPILELVILLGLGGALLSGGMPVAARFLFAGVSLLTGVAIEINRLLAKFPGAGFILSYWNFGAICLYYGLLASWPELRTNRFMAVKQTLWQHRTMLAAALTAVVSVLAVFSFRPGPLSVHFIDVGQGDAILVQTPQGRSVLIDAGGAADSSEDGFDVGERVVVPYLRHYGVKFVDLLILTHNHQDHAGGATAVVELLGARRVVANPGEEISPAVLRLQKALKDKPAKDPAESERFMIDGVKFSLLKAGDDVAEAVMSGKSENFRSTVVRLEYGVHSFLLTGDLEGKGEKKIIESGLAPSTVLKVGHHGAKQSCQPEFLAQVAPQYAVISVGADNPFGHPAQATLSRLQARGIEIFRTDRDGAIVFRSDGRILRLERTVPGSE